MYTQCPQCETTFQVTTDQLKAANGDVRCGQCLNIFSALDNLSEVAPHSEKHKDDSLAADTGSGSDISGDSSTSIDQNLAEYFGDLFEDSPDESFDKPIKIATPKPSSRNEAKPDSGFFYGANEATIEKILESEEPAHPESENETAIETKNGANIGVEDGIETGIFRLDELESAEPPAKTSNEDESNESLLSAIEKIDVTKSNPQPSNAQTSNPQPSNNQQVEEIDTTNVPAVILEELQAAKEKQLQPPNTPWMVGSIILMLVFVLQAVYFSRDTLAQNPTYRPLLTSACDILNCEINIKYDYRLIEIIGRDVRSHPTARKALIAGTTLINNASYVQPYPLLTLTFSNITGTVLAQRRFTPREYLRSGTDIAAGMPPEIPVQVELQLVDPGKAAVNFEFHAEVDPRA